MIGLLIALLIAFGRGATDVRVPSPADVAPEVYENGPTTTFVEWEGPGCGSFADEPCYVIVEPDLGGIELGP